MIRNLQPGETLPAWLDFGFSWLDVNWTWVWVEENEIKGIGITCPVYDQVLLLRLQGVGLKEKFWIRKLFQTIAKDCLARGYEKYFLPMTSEESKMTRYFTKRGAKAVSNVTYYLGNWRDL